VPTEGSVPTMPSSKLTTTAGAPSAGAPSAPSVSPRPFEVAVAVAVAVAMAVCPSPLISSGRRARTMASGSNVPKSAGTRATWTRPAMPKAAEAAGAAAGGRNCASSSASRATIAAACGRPMRLACPGRSWRQLGLLWRMELRPAAALAIFCITHALERKPLLAVLWRTFSCDGNNRSAAGGAALSLRSLKRCRPALHNLLVAIAVLVLAAELSGAHGSLASSPFYSLQL
jgi:hypothetical protein